MFYAIVFALVPRPKYVFWLGQTIGWSYADLYDWLKEKTIVYHRAKLMKLDTNFRLSEAERELVRRREDALKKGIGPMDPQYPDLYDVMSES